MACQIPGARLMVQTAMATARSVRIPAKGSERKTSQAYQRSITGAVIGRMSAIDCGTELPRSVPARTRTARIAISTTAARTEQKNLQTRSTTISGSARGCSVRCWTEACVIRVRGAQGLFAHISQRGLPGGPRRERDEPREELLVDAERHDRAHGNHHPAAYSGHQRQSPIDAPDDIGR